MRCRCSTASGSTPGRACRSRQTPNLLPVRAAGSAEVAPVSSSRRATCRGCRSFYDKIADPYLQRLRRCVSGRDNSRICQSGRAPGRWKGRPTAADASKYTRPMISRRASAIWAIGSRRSYVLSASVVRERIEPVLLEKVAEPPKYLST